uniref:Retrotransposon gag domain-containing protein n=1 Tax=Salix viminalis TaxID=40686 RepID=A0A6N2KT51_SALVM
MGWVFLSSPPSHFPENTLRRAYRYSLPFSLTKHGFYNTNSFNFPARRSSSKIRARLSTATVETSGVDSKADIESLFSSNSDVEFDKKLIFRGWILGDTNFLQDKFFKQGSPLSQRVLKPPSSTLEVYKERSSVNKIVSTNFWRLHWGISTFHLFLQERIFNELSMATRRNMITIVASKSNKAIDSSPNILLKILQPAIEDKIHRRVVCTNWADPQDVINFECKGAQDVASKMKPSHSTTKVNTQGDFDDSPMKTSPCQSPNKASGSSTMSVMMTETTSLEDQVANLAKLVEGLSTSLKAKDHEIAKLMNKLESLNERGKPQLTKLFITHQGSHHRPSGKLDSTLIFVCEAYTKNRPDALSYQPPKFQQFDGKGNPRQHIAHFVETCNNAGTNGDLMVMPLTGTLTWSLARLILGAVGATRRVVSMIELTNARQWKEEPVIDYIHRWRNLSLNCRDRLTETSALDMCIQGCIGTTIYPTSIKPKSFEELATRAHDMELSIAAAESSLPMQEPKRNKPEGRRFGKSTLKVEGKQSLVVNSTAVRVPTGVKRNDHATPTTFQRGERKKPSLKERQEKVYPFPDSDISRMLDDLLEANIIELPEVKRPEEANQVDNPNYCKYHRLISHPVEKCFVLKDKIMRLHENGDIVFDDEVAASNIITTVKSDHVNHFISFGSCEPIRLDAIFPMSFTVSSSQTPCITLTPQVDDLKPEWSENYDDEGWTLVTRRRGRRKHIQMTKPARMRISMVRKPISEPTRRKTQQKSIPVRKEGFSAQSIRKPVTLNEYMPTEMKRIENVPVACYQVEEEKTPIDHDGSSNLSHGVCTTEISFNDEDLLLGLHNRPLFIKGYVDEKIVNRILVDDGSAVNILPLKTMRELGFLWMNFSQVI